MVANIWALLLDRGFVNSSWIHANWVSIRIPRYASDHSPLFVASQAVPKLKKIPSFPLMRFGVEHPDRISVWGRTSGSYFSCQTVMGSALV